MQSDDAQVEQVQPTNNTAQVGDVQPANNTAQVGGGSAHQQHCPGRRGLACQQHCPGRRANPAKAGSTLGTRPNDQMAQMLLMMQKTFDE